MSLHTHQCRSQFALGGFCFAMFWWLYDYPWLFIAFFLSSCCTRTPTGLRCKPPEALHRSFKKSGNFKRQSSSRSFPGTMSAVIGRNAATFLNWQSRISKDNWLILLLLMEFIWINDIHCLRIPWDPVSYFSNSCKSGSFIKICYHCAIPIGLWRDLPRYGRHGSVQGLGAARVRLFWAFWTLFIPSGYQFGWKCTFHLTKTTRTKVSQVSSICMHLQRPSCDLDLLAVWALRCDIIDMSRKKDEWWGPWNHLSRFVCFFLTPRHRSNEPVGTLRGGLCRSTGWVTNSASKNVSKYVKIQQPFLNVLSAHLQHFTTHCSSSWICPQLQR